MKVLRLFQKSGENCTFSIHWLIGCFIILAIGACNESGVVDSEEMPEIISTEPADQSEGVPTNSSIVATFNKKINPSTVTTTTFTLTQNNTAVLGVVNSTDTTATFTPLGNFANDELYTATITTGVEDLSGNDLGQNYTWSFQTATRQEDPVDEDDDNAPDTTPPVIQSTDPSDHDEEVPIGSTVSATFSEQMNLSTLNESTFTLRNGTNTISGSVEYDEDSENTVMFVPSSDLPDGTTFTARITSDVEDTSGNAMEETYPWNFTTEEADETPPEIEGTNPEDGDDDVDEDVRITVTFDEEMDPSTINESTFTLEREERNVFFRSWQDVSGTVEYEDNTAIFVPNDELREDRSYRATITDEVTDIAGNQLEESREWHFSVDD